MTVYSLPMEWTTCDRSIPWPEALYRFAVIAKGQIARHFDGSLASDHSGLFKMGKFNMTGRFSVDPQAGALHLDRLTEIYRLECGWKSSLVVARDECGIAVCRV